MPQLFQPENHGSRKIERLGISRLPPSPNPSQLYFLDLELNTSAFINLSWGLETWFGAGQECVLFDTQQRIHSVFLKLIMELKLLSP